MSNLTTTPSSRLSAAQKAKNVLESLQREKAGCQVGDRNMMFAAHQRGQAEGYTMAIELINIWFSEELTEKKVNQFSGMKTEDIYHALNG